MKINNISELTIQYGLLFVRIGVVSFCITFFASASQETRFLTQRIDFFFCKKGWYNIWQHCLSWKSAPMCIIRAHYNKLCEGFVPDLFIWLKSHECPYMIVCFLKIFFVKYVKINVYHFLTTSSTH